MREREWCVCVCLQVSAGVYSLTHRAESHSRARMHTPCRAFSRAACALSRVTHMRPLSRAHAPTLSRTCSNPKP